MREGLRAGNSSGQASLEYILTLVAAVLFFMVVFNTLLKPSIGRLVGFASGRIDKALTQGNLHTLPFKR